MLTKTFEAVLSSFCNDKNVAQVQFPMHELLLIIEVIDLSLYHAVFCTKLNVFSQYRENYYYLCYIVRDT